MGTLRGSEGSEMSLSDAAVSSLAPTGAGGKPRGRVLASILAGHCTCQTRGHLFGGELPATAAAVR